MYVIYAKIKTPTLKKACYTLQIHSRTTLCNLLGVSDEHRNYKAALKNEKMLLQAFCVLLGSMNTITPGLGDLGKLKIMEFRVKSSMPRV